VTTTEVKPPPAVQSETRPTRWQKIRSTRSWRIAKEGVIAIVAIGGVVFSGALFYHFWKQPEVQKHRIDEQNRKDAENNALIATAGYEVIPQSVMDAQLEFAGNGLKGEKPPFDLAFEYSSAAIDPAFKIYVQRHYDYFAHLLVGSRAGEPDLKSFYKSWFTDNSITREDYLAHVKLTKTALLRHPIPSSMLPPHSEHLIPEDLVALMSRADGIVDVLTIASHSTNAQEMLGKLAESGVGAFPQNKADAKTGKVVDSLEVTLAKGALMQWKNLRRDALLLIADRKPFLSELGIKFDDAKPKKVKGDAFKIFARNAGLRTDYGDLVDEAPGDLLPLSKKERQGFENVGIDFARGISLASNPAG
jgi:hypothetical protein